MSGTSMAAPEVSGAAALVLAAHPTYSVAELRSRLISTADRLPGADAGRINGGNGGRLDVATAVGPAITSATGPITNASDVTIGGHDVRRPAHERARPAGAGLPRGAGPRQRDGRARRRRRRPASPTPTTTPTTGTAAPVTRVTRPGRRRAAPTVARR